MSSPLTFSTPGSTFHPGCISDLDNVLLLTMMEMEAAYESQPVLVYFSSLYNVKTAMYSPPTVCRNTSSNV